MQYSKKYCAISKEIRCNIQRNTVAYLRSVVTCSVGGDRNVTRERDAAPRPITAGLLVWHNFYIIFHFVFHLYFFFISFFQSNVFLSQAAYYVVWHNFYFIFHLFSFVFLEISQVYFHYSRPISVRQLLHHICIPHIICQVVGSLMILVTFEFCLMSSPAFLSVTPKAFWNVHTLRSEGSLYHSLTSYKCQAQHDQRSKIFIPSTSCAWHEACSKLKA